MQVCFVTHCSINYDNDNDGKTDIITHYTENKQILVFKSTQTH